MGYSNKSGRLWNLLRDDLGDHPDATPSNHETAYTRGILAGEYIINVHCYRCPVLPVPIDVEVSVKRESAQGAKVPIEIIATTRVVLNTNGQEATALRFKLDRSGNLVPGSMNHVFKPLRAMAGASGGADSHGL